MILEFGVWLWKPNVSNILTTPHAEQGNDTMGRVDIQAARTESRGRSKTSAGMDKSALANSM